MEFIDFGTYLSNLGSKPINFVCDLVLALVFVIFVVASVKRGFVKQAFSLLKPVGAIVIAVCFCTAFGKFLMDIRLLDGLTDTVKNSIMEVVGGEEFKTSHEGQTLTGFTGILGMVLAMVGNTELTTQLAGLVSGDEAVVTKLAETIVSGVSVVVAFVMLLILGGLILRFVFWVLELIFKLPGLNVLNGIVGGIVGLVEAAVIVWVLSFVLYFLITWLGTSFDIPFFAAFGDGTETYLENLLFHFNPIQFAIQALADSMVFA